MSLFGMKEKAYRSSAKALASPATLIVTCNSVPTHSRATYWFEVVLNGETVGKIERNGEPLTCTTLVDKNVLGLNLFVKENNGCVTPFGGRDQLVELGEGETAYVVFENRKFTVTTRP